MFLVLPETFQPASNAQRSVVNITMAPGTTLAQTGRVANEVEQILRTQPDVESVTQRVHVGSTALPRTGADPV